jgi:AbrB family looped-hinge helix DNA binding protein
MSTRLTIDGAGRVVLPKPLRKALDLSPGDVLELETLGEKITLRPVRHSTPLTKEKGVWVFRTGRPLPASVTNDLLKEIRDERDRLNLGGTE